MVQTTFISASMRRWNVSPPGSPSPLMARYFARRTSINTGFRGVAYSAAWAFIRSSLDVGVAVAVAISNLLVPERDVNIRPQVFLASIVRRIAIELDGWGVGHFTARP